MVEFGPNAANRDSFCDSVQKALGEKVSVSSLEPRVTLEIREFDCVMDVGEVKDALRKEDTAGETKVRVTPENTRGQRVAIIDLAGRDAKLMLDKAEVKIGFVVCRIRKRADPADA